MAQAISAAEPTASYEGAVPNPCAPPWEFAINSRTLGIALLTIFALLAVVACASDRPIVWATGKVLLPGFAFGLLPGLLLAVVCRGGARWELTELLAIAIATSLGLAQVPTLIGMGFGLPTSAIALAYAGILAAASASLCLRRGAVCRLAMGRTELLVLAAIVAVACVGYVKGSPFFCDEEQIHISVIRRLATVPAPNPHNIHPAAGFTFTHPYPGTHYFMALVTALGRGDTLFVYHKLRCCWIFASLLFLFVLARRIFEDRAIAVVTVCTGIALMLNGSFADFWVLYGGQLAPYSHPSDVAMGVLLPGLLLIGLRFFDATGRRDTVFFFGAAIIVAGMVTMSHIRETVQFLVYSACLLLVTVLFHRERKRFVRVGTLIAAIVLIAVSYGIVHRHLVQHITDYDNAAKAELVESLRTGTFTTLIATPYPFHENTLLFLLFYGWSAVLILGSPFVCLVFRRQPLVLMMGTSILVYLVIMRLPVLSILYTYFTHVDMMLVPVRNVHLFLYLMTGPLLYLLACQAQRLPIRWVGGGLAVFAALGLGLATSLDPLSWMAHYDWFFLPAIGLYLLMGAVIWFIGIRPAHETPLASLVATQRLDSPRVELRLLSYTNVVFAGVLLAAALGSAMWERSLLSLHRITTYSPLLGTESPSARSHHHLLVSLRPVLTPYWELRHTNAAFSDYKGTLLENVSIPPPPRLVEWARTELPLDAVLAANGLNAYPLPVFLPHRVTAWPPVVSFNLVYPKQVSPAYYEIADRSMAKHGTQPFFNTVETMGERIEFLRRTQATHVVLDPPNYRALHHVLLQWPKRFEIVYDDGEWAVFAAHLD